LGAMRSTCKIRVHRSELYLYGYMLYSYTCLFATVTVIKDSSAAVCFIL
jgi:hypothetical protein